MKVAAEIRARDAVMACFEQGGVGAEIGVHLGIHAGELLLTAKPRKFHLIDPWIALADEGHADTWYAAVTQEEMDGYFKSVSAMMADHVAAGIVEIHRKPSADAMLAFADNSLDWIYVDGDHSYTAVVGDLARAYAKVRPGGMIAGDDYKLGGWWGDGIVRAVHEFLAAKPVKLHLLMDDQFVIEKLG
jgi:Methyltransferase domain